MFLNSLAKEIGETIQLSVKDIQTITMGIITQQLSSHNTNEPYHLEINEVKKKQEVNTEIDGEKYRNQMETQCEKGREYSQNILQKYIGSTEETPHYPY